MTKDEAIKRVRHSVSLKREWFRESDERLSAFMNVVREKGMEDAFATLR